MVSRSCRVLAAFFTSATIFASSVAVNSFNAKATGHMATSSRFALSLKPNVAYRSIPVTWVTDYSDIGNTFGPNGFSIDSSRHVSSSK